MPLKAVHKGLSIEEIREYAAKNEKASQSKQAVMEKA
jgi:hypothetical protein